MMGWLKRLAGLDPETEQANAKVVGDLRKHDMGPVNERYLKRQMPRTLMTKAWTPARQKWMRDWLRHLRPEQRALVYSKGWNKGIVV